jgi:hypothetical protein
MDRYKITKVMSMFGGKVGLTDKQAKRRGTNLKPINGVKDEYEVIRMTQFKVGEVVRLAAPIDRYMEACTECLEPANAKKVKLSKAISKLKAKR